jgi:two-component system cell cycle response regulator DivK
MWKAGTVLAAAWRRRRTMGGAAVMQQLILIVEDDDDSRRMLELLLSANEYETMSARNGAEALELMRGRKPCLVLLDLQMPVMSGWEFREHQLKDPELADVPVLCVTAFFNPGDVEKELGLRCVPKARQFSEVLHEVKIACGEAHA